MSTKTNGLRETSHWIASDVEKPKLDFSINIFTLIAF